MRCPSKSLNLFNSLCGVGLVINFASSKEKINA